MRHSKRTVQQNVRQRSFNSLNGRAHKSLIATRILTSKNLNHSDLNVKKIERFRSSFQPRSMITPIGMCQILAILAFMAGGSVRAQGAILCASWAASANLHHGPETTNGVSLGGIRSCQISSIPNIRSKCTKENVDIDIVWNFLK